MTKIDKNKIAALIYDIHFSPEMMCVVNYNEALLPIVEMIKDAWNTWESYIVKTYWEGKFTEKPELPTWEFVENCIVCTDFDVAGFDTKALAKI